MYMCSDIQLDFDSFVSFVVLRLARSIILLLTITITAIRTFRIRRLLKFKDNNLFNSQSHLTYRTYKKNRTTRTISNNNSVLLLLLK